MRNKKLERAMYGPSWFEITFGGVLSIILGVVVAVTVLIFKPIETVKEKEMPKEEERDRRMVYYVEGSREYTKGRQWIRKRQLLTEGTPGEIVFIEEELNSWAVSSVPKERQLLPVKKKPDEKDAAKNTPPPVDENKPFPAELVTPYAANFKIRDGVVQAALPTMVNIPFIEVQLPVVTQARGDFVKVGEFWMFRPAELYVGSLPVHRFISFNEGTLQKFIDQQLPKLPEEMINLWKKVSDVSTDGRNLKVVIQ